MKSLRAATSFLTDVEGSQHFFQNFLNLSRVIKGSYQEKNSTAPELSFIEDDTHFVFGGDIFDKGSGDLSLSRELVNFKKKYPDRVTLLLGNRDINKMKLTSELDPCHFPRQPEDILPPYFNPRAQHYSVFLQQHQLPHSITSKLKWLLHETMGCPTTFELRRQELERNRSSGSSSSAISDDDVVESYLKSLRPGGEVYEYLQQAQLAAVHNGTIFVHGGISGGNVGFIPSREQLSKEEVLTGEDDARVPQGTSLDQHDFDVMTWIHEMNRYARDGVEDWQKQPTYRSDKSRGGGFLLAYTHDKSLPVQYSLVTSRYVSNKSLSYQYTDLKAVMYLNQNGINRVVSGHTPSGDSPAILCQPGLDVFVGDTSYSDSQNDKEDQRGKAVAEILLYEDGTTGIHGCRTNGDKLDFLVDGADPFLGSQTADGWWVRAVKEDGHYLLQKAKGSFYQLEYQWLEQSKIVLKNVAAIGAGTVKNIPLQHGPAPLDYKRKKNPSS